MERQMADEQPRHVHGQHGVSAGPGQRRVEAEPEGQEQHALGRPGQRDPMQAELHRDGQGDEDRGQAEQRPDL